MSTAYVTRDDIDEHLSSEPIAPVLPRLPELIEEASAATFHAGMARFVLNAAPLLDAVQVAIDGFAALTRAFAEGLASPAWDRVKRPGQWSDRARRRRARRLERAAERRFGLSRRVLRWGFPYVPPRPLAAIHEECRRAMVEADARALEQTIGATLPDGVTLTFPGPGMAVQDGLIIGISIAPTLDQEIQAAIFGKGGRYV